MRVRGPITFSQRAAALMARSRYQTWVGGTLREKVMGTYAQRQYYELETVKFYMFALLADII